VYKIFPSPFYLIFMSVHVLSQFVSYIFPVISLSHSLVSGMYIALVILTQAVQ
jgi:hypothetical protein